MVSHNLLMDVWDERGIEEAWQFGALSNQVYLKVLGTDKKGLCRAHGTAERANPRDDMHPAALIALIALKLGEYVAAEMAQQMDAEGFSDCMKGAAIGGSVARNAIGSIKAQMGRPLMPEIPKSVKITAKLLNRLILVAYKPP
jgi:hypothetical protein